MSKAIRQGLAGHSKKFKDTYMASRLTGLCRNIITKGQGELGKREGNLNTNPKLIIGFPLNKMNPFSSVCKVNYNLQIAANRSQISLVIPKITSNNLLQIPKGATHYTIILAVSLVSSFHYNENQKEYKPITNNNNAIGNSVKTEELDISQPQNINLNLQIDANSSITPQTAITTWLGIEFFQKTYQTFNPLIASNSMQCIEVF